MKKNVIRIIIVIDIIALIYILFQYIPIFREHKEKNSPKKETSLITKPSASEKALPLLPSLDAALAGTEVPDSIRQHLCVVSIQYFGLDSKVHSGYLLADRTLKEDIDTIFKLLLLMKFPIEKVAPLSQYGWSDSLSMTANNTSCFNYRNIQGSSRLSDHAFGRAIDINPRLNPYVKYRTGVAQPSGASHQADVPGTITENSKVVAIFGQFGWQWGGSWKYSKDYQHFYKK